MAFDTITGAASSTATTFGGAALNAVTNWLNGGGSEVANIYDDDLNIVNSAATTAKTQFDVSGVTAGQTRSLIVPDSDCKLGSVGTHEVWIPAGAMYTVETNGAEYAARELATNDIMISGFNFDTTTAEKAQFNWATPAIGMQEQ